MVNIRNLVAERLSRELQRKEMTADRVAEESGLPRSIIDGYLDGAREIIFAELRPLCNAIGINLMHLATPDVAAPQLIYRQTGPKNRQLASRIENSFILVRDYLPVPSPIRVRLDSRPDSNRNWLIANVNRVVEDIRTQYPTLESLIERLHIPVLPIIGAEKGFDAFLLSCKPHYVICLNMSKPTVRLHFSALHEIAHYLFDANGTIPVDQDIDASAQNFYRDMIPLESVSEFRANKFAQLYSVPLPAAEQMYRDLNRSIVLDLSTIDTARVSTDVVSNALFDLAQMNNTSMMLNAIKPKVTQAVSTQSSDTTLRPFIEEQGRRLRMTITNHRDDFSDEVWKLIADAWEIRDV